MNLRSAIISRWNTSAYLLLAVVLFLAAGTSWIYGDNHEHYNGFLVTFGWLFLVTGLYVCNKKPSSREMAAGFIAHKGKILPCLLLLFGFYEYCGDVLMYIAPSTTYGYAWKYDVADSMVIIEMRPHDCEWKTAPLGDKNCHYEAQVRIILTAAARDGITPLVSYDEGKTWQANTSHEEPAVFVSWTKVNE